jgi:ABC-type polysaccharide/polyol phosphate export permease
MTGVTEGFRDCLFGGYVDWRVLISSWIVTLLLLLLGSLHFRSAERVFADLV